MRKLTAVSAVAVAVVALTSCATDDPAERESQTRQVAKDACASTNITVDTPRAVIDKCKAAAADAGQARIRNRSTKYPEAKTAAEQEYLAAIELSFGAGAGNPDAKLDKFHRKLNLRIGRAVCTAYEKHGYTARDAADEIVYLGFTEAGPEAKMYVEEFVPVLCPDEARFAGKVGPYRPMS